MKADELTQLLSDIDETYINQARTPRKRPFVRYTLAAAACLAIVVTAGIWFLGSPGRPLPVLENRSTEPHASFEGATEDGVLAFAPQTEAQAEIPVAEEPEPYGGVEMTPKSLTVNWAESVAIADMDVAGFADWPGSVDNTPQEAFLQELGIAYEDFTDRLPEDWQVTGPVVLTVPDFDPETKEKSYRPHDFVLTCTLPDGGSVRIALCGSEEPLRDVYFVADLPLVSDIGGVPVEIYGFQTCFYAYCSDGVLFYDIETEDVSLLDLELLLNSLLKTE